MEDKVHLPPTVPPFTPALLESGSNIKGNPSFSVETPPNDEKLHREPRCIDSELSKLFNVVSITDRKNSMSDSKLADPGVHNPLRIKLKLNRLMATKFFEKNLSQKRILLAKLPKNRPDEEKKLGLAHSRLKIKVRKHFARQSDGTFKDMSKLDTMAEDNNHENVFLAGKLKKTPYPRRPIRSNSKRTPTPPGSTSEKGRERQNQQDENQGA